MDQARLTWIERTLLVLVLVLSLFLRVTALDAFLTSDEDLWFARSEAFDRALQQREWAQTYQTGHPGVVTMWLGTAAAELGLQPPSFLTGPGMRALLRAPLPAPNTGLPPLTVGARLLVALVSWLSILACYPLVRRLFGRHAALLAVILIALDPFYLGHSRFHHLDGLLTTFLTLSVLSLLVYQFRDRRPRYLLASAAAAGLAVASKSPGIFIAPCAGLVLLAVPLLGPRAQRPQALRRALRSLVIWGLVALGVLFAIWPALWVNPLGTLGQVLNVARGYAENAHEAGNFFWFAVRPDPGPAFYPVAWFFRTTPFVLLGLLGLISLRRKAEAWAPAAMLGLIALLFTLFMTLGAKKFDRYLLPVFPWLDILAAAGWVSLLQWGRSRFGLQRLAWAPAALGGVLLIGQFALVWPTRPYYITYYNPAAGGSHTAPHILVMGWGEGLDKAAFYLNGKPRAEELIVSSWHKMEFARFFQGQTIQTQLDLPRAEPDYYILYYSVLQRRVMPPISDPLLANGEPEYTATINGVDYAYVYPNTIYRRAEQTILEHITAQANPQEDLIIVDLNAAFARHYQGAVPLRIFAIPERNDVLQSMLQPAVEGRKRVWLISYPDGVPGRTALIARNLLQHATIGDWITVDGVRALRYDLEPGARFLAAEPQVSTQARFGDAIRLVGYDVTAREMAPGDKFCIRLYWQADAPVTTRYTAFTHFIGPGDSRRGQQDHEPQAGASRTTSWTPGEIIVDDHEIEVSADAPAGEYVIAVGMYPSDTPNPPRLPAYGPEGEQLPNNVALLFGFKVVDKAQ